MRALFAMTCMIVALGRLPLNATVIHVPATEVTIQAGIDAAGNGDTVLVADGTYTGEGNTLLDYHGKALTVSSENGLHH